MKFGEKLMQLRKKQGLSQEELAEKLGVSRQSVSKWESNNTYPETDKIVQICNIFDCSMDDLINDNVTDINQTSRSNKMNLNEAKDSFMEFITKTTNMFTNMSFAEGFKCLFKMLCIGFILYIVGLIICGTTSHIFGNIFQVFGYKASQIVEAIVKTVLYIIWFIVGIIILIQIFNTKYLDNYKDEAKNTNKEEKNESSENIVMKENNNTKEESSSLSILKVLSTILIWSIKFVIFWILFMFTLGAIVQIILLVLSASLIPIHSLFIGIFLGLLGLITISISFITIGIYFIGNKKVNILLFIIIFISSLVLCGVGTATTILSVKNINLIEDNSYYIKPVKQTLNLDYEDNLIIIRNNEENTTKYDYVIDEAIEENKIIIETETDTRYLKLNSYYYQTDISNTREYHINDEFNGNIKEIINILKNDLKKNQIHIQTDYSEIMKPTIIKGNADTIEKLVTNLKKLYLVEEINEENITHINVVDNKYEFPNGIRGYYNINEDALQLDDNENYECTKYMQETKLGNKIIYNCHYKERDVE